ncbi:hypothetical protein [Aeromicrobium sp. Leaf350]|uniref:hypothetical protein n=1 Tax=Aeromicrobium sp. Leaf350 TaxID=2876565 RepID=UPI001E3113F8|nr:hypothetical protein [Aeromicrobium sp. Leaf350]
MTPDDPPEAVPQHRERVRVTSPLVHAPAPQRRSARQEVAEQSTVGAVYVRSLVRAQRRAAIATTLVAAVSIGVLPVLFWSDLPVRTWTIASVPVVWIVLGVLVYPWVWWLGRAYVWRAEHNESTFVALMDSPTDPAVDDAPSPP